MSGTRRTVRRSAASHRPDAAGGRKRSPASDDVSLDGTRVVLLGLGELHDDCWAVLVQAGVRLEHVATVASALRALRDQPAPVAVAAARRTQALTTAVRQRRELASVYIVGAAALDSQRELRLALDAGVDDVMGVPFEPEVLRARVLAGMRAARLRARESLLRSLVANIPGALYRCDLDPNWTMRWLSDEIEQISGYPAGDFIDSAARTFASVIHPDDREEVERSVIEAVNADRPFTLEYRIQQRNGDVRWVLERGQAQESGDGRRWLDGAIFDITVRRAAEEALRESEIATAQLVEVRASRARILEAADRARREIESNLHDGAQQRFASVAVRLRRWLAVYELPDDAHAELAGILAELRAGLAELRDLAHGLHPAVLAYRGLEGALNSLAEHAAVPVELRAHLSAPRLPPSVEATAYFMVSEALTNVAKYAHATRAWIEARQLGGHLFVEVGDDGAGGAALRPGCGLQGLIDRVAAVSGTLTIDSPPGGGTVLRARLSIE